ncbi:MAG: DUF4112 domain-containing protein [Panacagrimonas sp.]
MPLSAEELVRTRATRERMEKLAWLLDGAVRIPGTKFRFGLDSIVGLIPGVGDVVGLGLGAAILYESVRVGAPRPLVMKMLRNSVLDALGGLVPVVGDVFDFAFKSNRRNAALLMEHLDRVEARHDAGSRRSAVLAILVVAVFLGTSIALIVWVWGLLLR